MNKGVHSWGNLPSDGRFLLCRKGKPGMGLAEQVFTNDRGNVWRDIMHNSAIVGINWGDEGKGRMVDLLLAEWRAKQ